MMPALRDFELPASALAPELGAAGVDGRPVESDRLIVFGVQNQKARSLRLTDALFRRVVHGAAEAYPLHEEQGGVHEPPEMHGKS